MANQTEALILAVQQQPALYDTTHGEYKCASVKNRIWYSIAEALGEGNGDFYKNKWKNLKDSYTKHLRCHNTVPGKRKKLIIRYKRWPWADQMAFIKPFLELAQTDTKFTPFPELAQTDTTFTPLPELAQTDTTFTPLLELAQTDSKELPHYVDPLFIMTSHEDTVSSNEAQQSSHEHREPPSRKRSFANESQEDRPIDFNHRADFNKNCLSEIDEVELLFLGYAKAIKKLSKKRQAIAKFDIAKIIMEHEIQDLEEENRRNNK